MLVFAWEAAVILRKMEGVQASTEAVGTIKGLQ